MATINIANLTFSHKGNYDGSTAYVKNDVVYYATNGNAYIAKQGTTGNAPTNGTYWSQFAAGSGGIWNAGLSLGSAGQAVKVNAAGNALEFGTISSDYVKLNTTTLGSNVANISIDGHFTADYKNYFMVLNVFPATNNANLIMRFNISNSAHSGSDYRGLISGSERYSSGQNFGNQGTHWYNHSSAYVTGHSGGLNDNVYNGGCRVEQTIYDPLNGTTHTHLTQQHVYNNNVNNNIITGFGGHTLQQASAVTGMTYYMDSGDLKAGSTFSLYGLKP